MIPRDVPCPSPRDSSVESDEQLRRRVIYASVWPTDQTNWARRVATARGEELTRLAEEVGLRRLTYDESLKYGSPIIISF